jgi:hypothetical protein
LHGRIFSLTPALSQKEREFSPFSLRESGIYIMKYLPFLVPYSRKSVIKNKKFRQNVVSYSKAI